MTIFERKNSKETIPFIDDHQTSLINALLMILIPTLSILGYIYISGSPEILFALFGKSKPALIFDILITNLVPFGITFYSLYYFAGDRFKALFQRSFWKQWKVFLFFYAANWAYSLTAQQLVHSIQNKGIATHMTLDDLSFSLGTSIFGMAIEELFAIPIFLAFGSILRNQFRLSRSASIYLALFISMILFGLMHFETYSWNLPQMIFVIGASRFFVTGSFIRSRNILVPYAIHYFTDALIYVIAFIKF
ncbi:CPBP family glutamic-type intramembrane protease [Furfurilactobacillus sp. WILCCON 0119]